MTQPNFKSDLVEGIKTSFDALGIRYDPDIGNTSRLAAQYFYIRFRMISAKPRSVHFSKALEAQLPAMDSKWTALVDDIKDHFQAGWDVSKFLSKKMFDATFNDGLWNDYGIHHFHLTRELGKNGRSARGSEMLLFAIVKESEAYFIDIAPHPDGGSLEDYGWVRQDLLTTANSNWPELCEHHIARGFSGDVLTDAQKKELRRKNVNVVHQVGDKAIFPMGGGLTSAGTNMRCQFLGDKLLWEIENLQSYCATQPSDIRAALKDKGHDVEEDMQFKLVLLDATNTPDAIGQLTHGNLKGSGWAIAEVTTGTIVDLSLSISDA